MNDKTDNENPEENTKMVRVTRSKKLVSAPVTGLKVVAAIPCYNTQQHVAKVITKTKRYVDEVIVIDDGSTDMTADVARRAGAKVISHKTNEGYGEAIRSCFAATKASNADVLITIDGDGQHDPDEILRILSPISKEECHIVIGSRFLASGREMPRYRKFGIGIINWVWNFGAEVKITDTQSGFRAYSRRAFDDVHFTEKGMSISIEIIEKARNLGLKIKEVPISCSYENNNSKLSPKAFLHGLIVAFSVVKIRLRTKVLNV
jgi:glycosyltransferase involved in cell wall biosynthesis